MINHGWSVKIDQIISNTYATCATSIYAISNLSDQSNLKMAKDCIFCSFFCINYTYYVQSIMQNLANTTTRSWGQFSTMRRCLRSSQTVQSNPRKWPKNSFLAIWIIQKGIFLIFEWSSIGCMIAKSCTPSSSIKICNIESIWCP